MTKHPKAAFARVVGEAWFGTGVDPLVASVCLIIGPECSEWGNDRGRGSARQRLV